MAILDDFTINTTLKTVRHTSGTTVYSVNALYSAIKDFEDNAANMDDEVIMTAQTPTEYTIVNGWFIDNTSTEFLNGGAITTSGYLNEIQRVVTTDAGTNPIPTDIGKQVNDGGHVGPLLHYAVDINDDGTQVNSWYVRTGTGTALTGALTITTGTGAQTVSTSVDGEEVWANVYHLGTIAGTPSGQFYIEQQLNSLDHRLIEWTANSNFSPGNLDVLVRVQVEGALIDSGNLLVTLRQPGDYYDSTEVTVTGGRNPMPINSAVDADNTSSEYYFLFDGETGTDFAVGDSLTADAKAWYCEVVEVGYFTDTTTGYLGVRGLNESIDTVADNDAFTSSGTGTALVNGTPGDRVFHVDAETGNFTVGLTVTDATGAKGIVRGIEDEGTDSYLVTEVNHDFRADNNFYDAFTENDTITDTSTGSAVVDLATLNLQNGVSGFDDIDIVFQHGSISATGHNLTEGMHVTQGAATGTITKVDGATLYIGNTNQDFVNATAINDDDSAATGTSDSVWTDSATMTKAFQQGTLEPYAVVVFCNNRSVSNIYEYMKFRTGDGNETDMQMYNLTGAALVRTPVDGQFYLSAYYDLDTPSNTYDKIGKRTAPLGTFAGGVLFAARGIWLQDVAAADATNFQLIDSNNVTRDPPNFVNISQTNTVSGDRVFVVEDDGNGKTSKTTYNSHASNNVAGDTTFDVDGTPTIRTDTPSSGILRVVDDSSTSAQLKEHRYRFASFSGDTFTLATASTGTITVANAAGTTLIDSSATFITDGVEPGDMVRNTTDGSISQVESVDSEIQLTTKKLEGGTDDDYDAADAYEVNTLVVTYVAADTAYTPYIDRLATGTTESVTVIYSANRNLIGKCRNKGVIFAFTGTGTLNNTGASISTVRNPDNIFTP
jgi:hypothetical protein